MSRVVSKIFLLLSKLPMMIQISGKNPIKKVSSIKKITISKAESLLKSNFDLKQNSAYTIPLSCKL